MKNKRMEIKQIKGLNALILILAMGLAGLIFLGITGCEERDANKYVDLEKGETLALAGEKKLSLKGNPLRIAIGSMITPREGYVYYKKLLDYIEERIGRPVKYVDRDNYSEVNSLLKTGEIDVAFVCGRPYVDGHDEFGLELLVAPQIKGKTVYHSYFIVHIDSPIKTFDELRGKTFAFTDPKSNTGKLVPTYMLALMNETPDSFFEKYIFTYAHDKSIKAVTGKIVEGAAVDSLIWDYYNKFNPEITSKTRIIHKSPPFGIQPVVIPPGIDPETRNRLKEIFLSIHEDEEGREILEHMMIDKFTIIDDDRYDSIRAMISRIEQVKDGDE